MLEPVLKKNDKKAKLLIFIFSVIVFTAITLLAKVKIEVDLGFDVHLFAKANALINSVVAFLLIVALIAVKAKNYTLHKNVILTAMFLSILFLVSYICHHLFTAETRFGDTNLDGIISETEKAAVGNSRMIYYIILGTHIPLYSLLCLSWPDRRI